MNTKISLLKQRLTRKAGLASTAVFLMGTCWMLSACTDNLLTGTPSWLGSSIYEELESRGEFKQTLALINDPDLSETNYPEMLRRTGSMTLFVAPDQCWDNYLAKRNITSLTQLSKAEKKNLLKSAMVNNAYLIELLSNTPGDPPSEGACMRRASRLDITDSIPLMLQAQYPAYNVNRKDSKDNIIDYWAAVREKESIYIYKDNSAAPMVHFLPDFMSKNDLTSVDWLKLSNGAASDVSNTSYVNGKKVVKQDITCQNGYIHILEDVPVGLDNMAEIIHQKPQFSIFSALLDRFSYPQKLAEQTVDGKTVQLYVKRYFNNGGQNHSLNTVEETQQTVSSVLSIDPGWNQYVMNTSNSNMTYQMDGGAMFVPVDSMMQKYITEGEGIDIGKKYGYDWNKVPDDIVLPFLNNCIKSSFISTTPSKFSHVKNTASEEMGIKIDDVDSCFMACNGVVYQLNKTFVAPEHQSVLFPAMLRANEDMSVIYKAITDSRYSDRNTVTADWTLNEYQAYVNSMASTYSFLIPTNTAFASYIDPYSIYEEKPIGYQFYIDPSSSVYPVSAKAFEAELQPDGTYKITDVAATGSNLVSLKLVNNRLNDILENIIVVHGQRHAKTFHPEQEIYVNKAGSPIKVQFEGNNVVGVAGSEAINQGRFIPIQSTTDLRENGNGVSYVLNELPMTTLTSPYAVIQDITTHPEFESFANLLTPACSFVGQEINKHPSMDYAFSILGNYNYTIYVPQNSAIDALTSTGKLPTWELWDEWDNYPTVMQEYAEEHPGTYTEEQLDSIQNLADSCKTIISDVIENFLRYHFQDGSVYIGGTDTTAYFESAAIDTAMSRFYRYYISNVHGQDYTIKDNLNHYAKVIKDEHSNLATRQYLFTKSTRFLYSTAYAVVHQIDKALEFSEDQYLPSDFPKPYYPEDLIIETQGVKYRAVKHKSITAPNIYECKSISEIKNILKSARR